MPPGFPGHDPYFHDPARPGLLALLAINGSLGTGIAILGVFGLVRFRSMPGSGPDIAAVFLGMVSGLLISTGNVGLAFALILLLGIGLALAAAFSGRLGSAWTVRILIPENTESFETYTGILKEYGHSVRLNKVRSMNMGTMYELEYTLYPDRTRLAAMLEAIRSANHNLNIQISDGSPDLGL